MKDTQSQAERTRTAEHEDELSPAKIVRDRSREAPSQRIGDNTTAANPVTSFPEGPSADD